MRFCRRVFAHSSGHQQAPALVSAQCLHGMGDAPSERRAWLSIWPHGGSEDDDHLAGKGGLIGPWHTSFILSHGRSLVASALSHVFVGIALGRIYRARPMPWRFWVLSGLCAVLPDADVVGFAVGVDYDDLLGHRGLSHSVCFAFVLGGGVVCGAFRDLARFSTAWWSLVLYFTVVTVSHGVLDALTDGGLGVAFFAPFDTTRYFLPWRPVRVSPISVSAFFSLRGLSILYSELLYIWLPTGLLLGLCTLVRSLVWRKRSSR
jgi:inner membrane protein